MSKPNRRHGGFLESRCGGFHCAVELEDAAAGALDLDKLRNSGLRVRLDFRGKTNCSDLLGKLRNGNTGIQWKTDVTQRLLAGWTEYDVVLVIAERQEERSVVALRRLGQSDGFEIVLLRPFNVRRGQCDVSKPKHLRVEFLHMFPPALLVLEAGASGQRRPDAFWRHGQLAQPPAGRMGEGVGKGSRGWCKRAFSRAERRIASLQQNDVDAGDLGEGEDGIRRPVPARDLAPVEGDLLLQRETDRLDYGAFELALRAVRIDHDSEIGRHHHAGHLDDTAVAVDLDVDHGGRIHPDALVPAKRQAAAALAIAFLARRPPRLVGGSLQHRLRPGIPEMGKTERQGIAAGSLGEVGHERLYGGDVAMRPERSER